MEKLKVGILGLRRGMTYLHNFLHLDNCVIIGAADRLPGRRENARKMIEEAGAKTRLVGEFEELLDMKPDAVMVATNARVHADHAIQALDAGCHVVSEIPAAFTEDELIRLRDTVERTGKMYMCGENYAFLDFMRYWRKWYLEGKFGEISCTHCEYVHYLPDSLTLPDGRCLSPSEAEAEGLADQAVPVWRADQPPIQYLTHDLGPALELLDDRAGSVTCMESAWWCKEAPLRSDAQIGLFKTARGNLIQCMVTLNTRVPSSHRFRILGTEGGAEWFSHEKTCRVFFGDREERAGWVRTKLGIAAQEDDTSTGHGGVDLKVARAFTNAILEGRDSPVDVYRGIEYTLPGIIAARSAEQGGVPLEIPDLRREPFTGTRLWDHFRLPENADIDRLRMDNAPKDVPTPGL